MIPCRSLTSNVHLIPGNLYRDRILRYMPTILANYLHALRVPHTATYADQCFEKMPFKTLFGLGRVLDQFGVESRGLKFSNKALALKLPVPFIAQMHGGLAIVTAVKGEGRGGSISYESAGKIKTVSSEDFLNSFTGVVFQSVKLPGAKEQNLATHRFEELADRIKMPLLLLLLLLLSCYGSIKAGVWHSVWSVLVFLFDIAGVAVCYLLWLKTNGVKSRVADSMCGLTTPHGCDKVLDTRLSSFLGIFKWSEVGMGYFAVSLLTLLIFPEEWSTLALFNACCLPYTIWSVLSQKFIIKAWCTLCLTVQTLLWCLFICYLLGGAWKGLGINLATFVLLASYICAVLIMNLVNHFIIKAKKS